MILYEFQCPLCGLCQDEVLPMEKRNDLIICNECGFETKRIVGSKIERVAPTWLGAAVEQLVPHGSDIQKPRDRNEFDLYCKVNKIDVSHGGGPFSNI